MKVVWVKWIDSDSLHGWQPKSDYKVFTGKAIVPCDSVGMLVHESATHIVILQSNSVEQADGTMKIPKVAVISMKKIAEVDVEI